MGLLWFTESQKDRLQSSLHGKTFCFILVDNISALIIFASSWGGGQRPSIFRKLSAPIHQPIWPFPLPPQMQASFFCQDFLNVIGYIWKRKKKSPATTPCCPPRFFFPLESGWKRPWDTCDILLHSLMRYWQPLGCYSDKGGKRVYIEEISQGFGRKEAKWQSN